jgi:hypothetical protein
MALKCGRNTQQIDSYRGISARVPFGRIKPQHRKQGVTILGSTEAIWMLKELFAE